jgi:hypothetical protein
MHMLKNVIEGDLVETLAGKPGIGQLALTDIQAS